MNRIVLASIALLAAGGCANTLDRIADIGEPPKMAAVENQIGRAHV